MNKKIALAGLASFALALPGVAGAVACKDAKGKFIKCPPAAAAPAATPAGGITKDAKGKCHIASGPKKGQFTKCPS